MGLREIGINHGSVQSMSLESDRILKRINAFMFTFELARKLPAFASMQMIEKRTSIKAIKRKLQTLGHWEERADNRATPALTRAIKNFQAHIKQVPLGIPTQAMIKKLRSTTRKARK